MMAQLRRDFQWRGNIHTCLWAGGQPMGTGIQLALGVARQVHAREPILAQQPRGVLVDAVWPWAVWDRQRIP